MSNRLWCSVGLGLVLCAAFKPVNGQEAAPQAAILTGGFADHLEPGQGGRVDWSNGYILGEGIGYAEGTTRQDELLARHAARQVAIRNAVALAEGVRIDASGTIGGLRDGTIRVRGLVRGHREVEAEWFPQKDQPEARVVVRVPLWGVNSVATVFGQSHRARLNVVQAVRRPLVIDRADVSDLVLVIDARGVGLSASLFPVVADTEGGVLYDLNTLSDERAAARPLARFVESELAFDELQAAVESGVSLRYVLACHQPGDDLLTKGGGATPSTQPTTQPVKKRSKRRAKRRMVVRAAAAGGDHKTELVLTREDVDRIRRSPEGASALREAHVVIVVDSAAAGIEGRLYPAPGSTFALKHKLTGPG